MNFGLNYKLNIIFLSVTSLILIQNSTGCDSEHPWGLQVCTNENLLTLLLVNLFLMGAITAALSQMLPISV